MSPSNVLRRLESVKTAYEPGDTSIKISCLIFLQRRRLKNAEEVFRLHEVLCFLRAYPDNGEILARVEKMLNNFSRRGDLKNYRDELASSGIAGTNTYYQFFWPMARWLARRCPGEFKIDWKEVGDGERLIPYLPLLVSQSETSQFDDFEYPAREWIKILKGNNESDAGFLMKRMDAIYSNAHERETLHDRLDLDFIIEPGEKVPTTTLARYPVKDIVYQDRPFRKKRPVIRNEIRTPPASIRRLAPAAGEKLLDMGREAMVTHQRDLDAFSYGDRNDVQLIEFADGYQFACIGMIPERRYLLPVIYGFLNLKNGVPIGYFQTSTLYGLTEVSFNTFSTFRGAEASLIYARAITMTYHLFNLKTYALDNYQLGLGNKEGIDSGVWWFYYKLGFRPRDREVRRVLRNELARMKKNPGHRSTEDTLTRLAQAYMYLDVDPGDRQEDFFPLLWNIAPALTKYISQRFGADRETAVRTCSREAADLVGLRSLKSFDRHQKNAWNMWAPLIINLPNINRWSNKNRKALINVVKAKGGKREAEFNLRYDSHPLLHKSIIKFARDYES